jgi:hypothetical protein
MSICKKITMLSHRFACYGTAQCLCRCLVYRTSLARATVWYEFLLHKVPPVNLEKRLPYPTLGRLFPCLTSHTPLDQWFIGYDSGGTLPSQIDDRCRVTQRDAQVELGWDQRAQFLLEAKDQIGQSRKASRQLYRLIQTSTIDQGTSRDGLDNGLRDIRPIGGKTNVGWPKERFGNGKSLHRDIEYLLLLRFLISSSTLHLSFLHDSLSDLFGTFLVVVRRGPVVWIGHDFVVQARVVHVLIAITNVRLCILIIVVLVIVIVVILLVHVIAHNRSNALLGRRQAFLACHFLLHCRRNAHEASRGGAVIGQDVFDIVRATTGGYSAG